MTRQAAPYFQKQLDFTCAHQSYQDCQYYPCHAIPENQKDLNCFLCYCPFYPCEGSLGPGKFIKQKDGKEIWDCSTCGLVHRDDVVKRMLELLYENKNLKQIKKILRKEFCRSKSGR